MRYLAILYFLIICLSCKTYQKLNFNNGIPFDDTFFDNKENELFAIYTKLNSLEQDKDILIIIDKKKVSFKKFKNYLKTIDSTYSIKIIKDKENLNKYRIAKNYKTLILINKKSP